MSLFAELGGLYTCDLFHDDQPTPVTVRGGQRFVSVPYSLELNDTIAYVVNKIEPRRYGRMIIDAFDRLWAEGAQSGMHQAEPGAGRDHLVVHVHGLVRRDEQLVTQLAQVRDARAQHTRVADVDLAGRTERKRFVR